MPRTDDPAISDSDILWRRIWPQWLVSSEVGGFRPSSAAFLDGHTNEVSVNIARMTTQEKVLKNLPEQSLAAISAGVPRSLEHKHIVASDPLPDDPSHAVICPPEIPSRQRKTAARKMAEAACWVVLQPQQ
jgi:hypothetical protein